jgi:hypothetical protein
VAGKDEEEFPRDWFWQIIREKLLELGVIKPNASIRSYPPVVCWIPLSLGFGKASRPPPFPFPFGYRQCRFVGSYRHKISPAAPLGVDLNFTSTENRFKRLVTEAGQ